MRIIVTGGHPGPALAVIDKISSIYPDWKIFFVGTKTPLSNDKGISFEYKEIASRSVPFIDLSTGKFDRASKLSLILNVIKVISGYFKSLAILNRVRPDVVLCFGGYLAVPVAFGAKTLGIKVLTHEQTFTVGFANRLIALVSDKVLLSWEETKKTNPKWSTVVTGLPIRKVVIDAIAESGRRGLPMLLIMGGSQGAHYINELIGGMIDELLDRFVVVQQVGDSSYYNDYELLATKRKGMSEDKKSRWELFKHISTKKIGGLLEKADIVVSRAGINTVAELMYLKKKALLIPLLVSINPEQLENAIYYQKTGLGTYLKQEEITAEKLIQALGGLVHIKVETKQDYRSRFKVLGEAATNIVKEIAILTDEKD